MNEFMDKGVEKFVFFLARVHTDDPRVRVEISEWRATRLTIRCLLAEINEPDSPLWVFLGHRF